nr:glycoside-pentoside-hexuronide (GPH):cation symporter [uncultured Mediterraneibacter sp.]
MAKTKKELGLDSMGVQKSMRMTDYLGDGLGQLPLNIMGGLVGQLTYFYTEKVGLAAGMVATMLLIAKIFDAFSDLIMGKIMDAGKSPKGKCRPWFIRMAIPAAVMIVLLFTVPKNAGSGIQSAYVLITNILITAVVYTAVAIPYGALMAMRTESSDERGKMGIFRAAFGYIAGMVIAILLIPITNMLGGTQSAWIKVSVIFALISLLSLLVLYKVTKENAHIVEKSEDEDVTFGEGIKMLFKNKYWVIMLVLQFMMNISYGLSSSGGTYYAKYILGNDNIVALLGAVGLIPTFLGFILTGPLASKLGMTKTCMVSCVMGAAACLVRVFTPYSLMTCIVGGAVTTFANIPLMCLFGAMVNNCVEYNDYKFGKRIVGMTNSANSFGSKIGSGIGASLIGWLLAAAGYNAALEVQPASVDTAIFAFGIYIPLVLFVIMFILLLKNDLEKRYPEIVAELQKRKEAK